jgi:hypothetical protein
LPSEIPARTSKGEDKLVENPEDYEHSSALFYILAEKGRVLVTTYLELQDIDLTEIVAPQSP